ncbi:MULTISPECIES: isoprenylcysteine carboxylmethyltransferase family protein [unclassified Achromobacter]|uniref:methyltransferase family protein n=1 Tax=unclassified Achromobacter TaxID=2626865 RepID=UPI000B515B15|nr:MULTISPECIES: isoprenylcysteine carboxylmethyltransferase family protein [unclassified Achromobacter]OWT72948.1 isoprenylcysteine carboxyl methyltransferase [Achromobacter sp. HZ34]OWT74166.1 isoprenylcysteine carboxyl methyltransferase [Achromobacter sp. HZ28]
MIVNKTAQPTGTVSARLERIQNARRLSLWIVGVLTAIAALFFQSTWDIDGSVHHNIEVVGMLMIFVAILGRGWCSLYLGGNKNRELIALGPYSISRNPLYVFSLLGAFGIGAQSGSVALAFALGVVVFAVFSLVIRHEESVLKRKFPDTFAEYCRSTPRFGPRFGNWRNTARLTISLEAWEKTVREALLFLLAIPILESIEALQAHDVLAVLLRLP